MNTELEDNIKSALSSNPALRDKILALVAERDCEWLRSEIEKLEGMKINDFGFIEVQLNGITHKVKAESDRHIFYNTALTSIITRYTEELKVLESK